MLYHVLDIQQYKQSSCVRRASRRATRTPCTPPSRLRRHSDRPYTIRTQQYDSRASTKTRRLPPRRRPTLCHARRSTLQRTRRSSTPHAVVTPHATARIHFHTLIHAIYIDRCGQSRVCPTSASHLHGMGRHLLTLRALCILLPIPPAHRPMPPLPVSCPYVCRDRSMMVRRPSVSFRTLPRVHCPRVPATPLPVTELPSAHATPLMRPRPSHCAWMPPLEPWRGAPSTSSSRLPARSLALSAQVGGGGGDEVGHSHRLASAGMRSRDDLDACISSPEIGRDVISITSARPRATHAASAHRAPRRRSPSHQSPWRRPPQETRQTSGPPVRVGVRVRVISRGAPWSWGWGWGWVPGCW